MFIKIWQLIILYIDQMDWRAGHLTTTEGTGGRAFANKNCLQGRAFEIFFKCPGYARWFARGGMLAAGIDLHIKNYQNIVKSFPIFRTAFASSSSGDNKNLTLDSQYHSSKI